MKREILARENVVTVGKMFEMAVILDDAEKTIHIVITDEEDEMIQMIMTMVGPEDRTTSVLHKDTLETTICRLPRHAPSQ